MRSNSREEIVDGFDALSTALDAVLELDFEALTTRNAWRCCSVARRCARRLPRKNHRGDIETIPPAHLDHGQPRTNSYHHPEKHLRDGEGDDEAP